MTWQITGKFEAEVLASNYPDIKRPLRERACVGPWTSSTMHYKDQNMAIQKNNHITKKASLTFAFNRQDRTKIKQIREENRQF